MTPDDLLRQRLNNQRLSAPLRGAQEVVTWLGAVQAQEYPGAKWAVAQRARGVTDASIDAALAAGTIIRTHVMRPTWHFVPAADARWMLELTAPRVNTVCGSYYRKMKLDDRVFARSNAVMAAALRGGRSLTRAELASALRESGVISPADDRLRLAFMVMRAELDAVICSGPRIGSQFTYARFDDRVPRARTLGRDDARSELAVRYFRSHGPATVKDFMWWSGLTAVDARAALEAIRSELMDVEVEGKTYWRPKRRAAGASAGKAYLLPTYDECFVAYRDRVPIDGKVTAQIVRDSGRLVVIDGALKGTWRRSMARDAIQLQVSPFRALGRADRTALAEAVDRFARFAARPVTLSLE